MKGEATRMWFCRNCTLLWASKEYPYNLVDKDCLHDFREIKPNTVVYNEKTVEIDI